MTVTPSPDEHFAYAAAENGIAYAMRALKRRVQGLRNNQKNAKSSEAIRNTAARLNQWQAALNDYIRTFGANPRDWNNNNVAEKINRWDQPRRDRLLSAIRQFNGIFSF